MFQELEGAAIQIKVGVTRTCEAVLSHIYDLDYRIATGLIQRGMINVDALITGRISMDNVIAEGLEEFMNNGENHIKILASPHLM